MSIINNVKMKKKLLLSYLIIVIIPILLIGYFLTERLYSLSFASSIQLSDATFKQMAGNYGSFFTRYRNIAESIVKDGSLRRYLDTYYLDDYESYYNYKNQVESFINSLKSNDNSLKIEIFTNNNTIGFSRVTNNQLEELDHEKWYTETYAPGSSIIWTKNTNIPGDDRKYIGCYKMLYGNYTTNAIDAVVSVFFSEDHLYSLISKEKEAGKIIFLIDGHGSILTSTERDMLFKSAKTLEFNGTLGVDDIKNASISSFNGKKYIVFNTEINSPDNGIEGWRLLYMLPEDKLIGDIYGIWISSVLLCLVCILFSFMVIIFISDNITNRLANLVNKINKVWQGDYAITYEITGTDEVGVLESDFFKMAKRIDELINEVYDTSIKVKDAEIKYQKIQMQKKDAELIVLYGRINPHYFFNTLEAIRMNLIRKNDRETAFIVKEFSESFRAYMDNERDVHEISKELELAQNYYHIQKYRFGDKVDMSIDISEHLNNIKIPKLIIQPLVENAIMHGLEPKLGDGTVVILISEAGSKLNIIVSDDGIGIGKEELKALITSLSDNEPQRLSRSMHGMALKNIYERLALFYGNDFSFKIFSEKGTGTRVELAIPMIMCEDYQISGGFIHA